MKQTSDQGTDSNVERAITIVSSCNQYYFPLFKGLALSILDSKKLPSDIDISFIDLGCDGQSLTWLRDHGINIGAMDNAVMGPLADEKYGYRRAQICRPYLPDLFPDTETLVWMDCDTWVQDVEGLLNIFSQAHSDTAHMYISVEVHADYCDQEFNLKTRIEELHRYYLPIYGESVASSMSILPVFNSGIFAMSRHNPLWNLWRREIENIYITNYDRYSDETIHFAEQLSLNVLLKREKIARIFDPMYNFLCLWNPPFRDHANVVRSGIPPHLPLGVLHLAGGWRHFKQTYLDRKLLYNDGEYLSQSDKESLFPEQDLTKFR